MNFCKKRPYSFPIPKPWHGKHSSDRGMNKLVVSAFNISLPYDKIMCSEESVSEGESLTLIACFSSPPVVASSLPTPCSMRWIMSCFSLFTYIHGPPQARSLHIRDTFCILFIKIVLISNLPYSAGKESVLARTGCRCPGQIAYRHHSSFEMRDPIAMELQHTVTQFPCELIHCHHFFMLFPLS